MRTLLLLVVIGLMAGCAGDLAHHKLPTGGARTVVSVRVGTDTGHRQAFNGDMGFSATQENNSKATGQVAGGVVGLAAVNAYEAVETGAQGVKKATSIASTKAGTTRRLSDNATKVKMAEIAAGP